MTVYSQEYTLHCVKTGHIPYNFEMRLNGSTVTSASGCTNTLSSCSGRVLLQDFSNTYDHTVTISWDGQTITSGSTFIQSNTGDQTFQCNMWANNQPRRLRDVTRNVVSTSEDEIVLTDLSPMSTYHQCVLIYRSSFS